MDDTKEYSVSEFRKNIRAAFDGADDMIDIYIKRHDKRYYLCTESYYKELLKPTTPAKDKHPDRKQHG